MSDFYKQVFLREFEENRKKESDFSLFESVAEIYERNACNAKNFFSRLKTVKDRVSFYKAKTMADLPNHLIDFESKFNASGGRIIYAEDRDHALSEIMKQLPKEASVFLARADIFQEIGLKRFLRSNGIKFFQSDMQKLPFPVLEDCSEKVLSELAKAYASDTYRPSNEEAVSLYRQHLAEKMRDCSVAITGADFLVCDIGGISLSDNDGLGTLYASFCRKHIVVAGIDQFIPSLSDLDYFTSLLSAYSSGRIHSWNEMVITGSKHPAEPDGPEELCLILVDNGRTGILAREFQRRIFDCIHCNACMALCPVFKFTNRTGDFSLKGPLNCVCDPIRNGFQESGYLAFSCTLCGKCSEVCPSGINLHELILHNRKESVESNAYFSIEKKSMKVLKKMLLRQKSFHSPYDRFILKMRFKKDYGQQREFPDFGQKSFRLLWEERQQESKNA